jgi:hypothetical protein
MFRALCLAVATLLTTAGCATTQTADNCGAPLTGNLDAAMSHASARLAEDCTYHFDRYFQNLLAIAENNPDPENPRRFSDFLMTANERGIISRRQAESLYNRYFNVKFVSLQGDYNTCSQTCPVRGQVLSEMQAELHDKEMGLLRASEDSASFYRADGLLKEAELVLEATCRACEAGGL